MPKTDEKPIDIAAEIRAARNAASDMTLVSSDWLDDWADRIERAAKRDYEEAKSRFEKMHDGPSMICTSKNCSLRNAAEDIVEQVKAEASFGHFAPVVVEERPGRSAREILAKDKPTYTCVEIAPGNAAAMREALEYAREVLTLNGFVEPVVRCDAALVAPPRACDVLAKEQLANDIIKAIDEGVPGWAKVSELEKSLAYAVVNATVNAAYSTAVAKTDKPKDEQHGGAPAPDGAERGANGDTK